jgi:hypothetical protein
MATLATMSTIESETQRTRARSAPRGTLAAIDLRAHGPLALQRFGHGELQGGSAMQFIETSTVTVHADKVGGRCFIDVFSCFGGVPTLTLLRR